MYKVKIVKANRGFWNDLFNVKSDKITFVNKNISSSELISENSKKLLWRLSQIRIFDLLGVFQQIKVESGTENGFFSYNRFLKTNKPYLLAVENPTAMVHYHPRRALSILGKHNLKKVFSGNLKTIVCLSKACMNTLNVYYSIPPQINVMQVYPLIKDSITSNEIKSKINSPCINCLFISSQFYLKGGRELIEAIKRNHWNKEDIHFDIITAINSLEPETLNDIKKFDNVNLYDYSFSKKELNDFYKKANVFINLTRKDSFSLVTLEALKYGCAFITTDLYAIREMVKEGYNGFLKLPVIKYWNDDGTMNTSLSQKDKIKLASNYYDQEMLEFLSDKMNMLIKDRKVLGDMQYNSFKLANTVFDYDKCKEEWIRAIKSIFE